MRERDAGPAGDVRIDVSITDASLDGFDRFADLGSHSDGAVSIFQGRVRETNEGRRVVALLYEAYAEMAEGELRRICEEAAGRFDVSEIRAAHRTGVLELGEVSAAPRGVLRCVPVHHRGDQGSPSGVEAGNLRGR